MIKNISLFTKPDAKNKYGIIAQIAVPLIINVELNYSIYEGSSVVLKKEQYLIKPNISGWELNYMTYIPKKEDFSLYYYSTEENLEPNLYLYFGTDITGKTNNSYFYILYNCKNNIISNIYNVSMKYADSYSADIALFYPIGKDFWSSQYATMMLLSIIDDNFIAYKKLFSKNTNIETLLNKQSNLDGIYLRTDQIICFKNAIVYDVGTIKFYISSDGYNVEFDLLEIIKINAKVVSIVGHNIKPKTEIYIQNKNIYIKSLSYLNISSVSSRSQYSIVNAIPEDANQITILSRDNVTTEDFTNYKSNLTYSFLPYLCNKNLFYRHYNYNIGGTFEDRPTTAPIGFSYFCTDKQTTEGSTNGIMIYHKGNNVWVDALGRVVS